MVADRLKGAEFKEDKNWLDIEKQDAVCVEERAQSCF